MLDGMELPRQVQVLETMKSTQETVKNIQIEKFMHLQDILESILSNNIGTLEDIEKWVQSQKEK